MLRLLLSAIPLTFSACRIRDTLLVLADVSRYNNTLIKPVEEPSIRFSSNNRFRLSCAAVVLPPQRIFIGQTEHVH